jgi:hypothetical protein
VVSLVPSLTEAIAVTLSGILVGATDYCTHPSTLDSVARVGGSKYPKLESVLAAQPDLVVANAEENREQDVLRLRAEGIPVWVTEAAHTVPAGLASVRHLLVDALDAPEPRWLLEAEHLWAKTESVRATAVIPVWRKPWVVIGRDTFAGDVLRRLGIANVYADDPDRYPRPTLDDLRARFAGGAADARTPPANGGADVRATGGANLRAQFAGGAADSCAQLASGTADLLVLPDEPYLFTAEDGPEAFPGVRYALVSGRHLTWCGPSLVEAKNLLSAALA